MNQDQAKAAFLRIFQAFPSYREWLNKTDNPGGTLVAWCQMLAPCEPVDVGSVVDLVMAGGKILENFDSRDQLPVRIKQRADEFKASRELITKENASHKQATPSDQRRRDSQRFVIEVMRRATMKDPEPATAERIDQRLTDLQASLAATDDEFAHRFNCLDCRDTGIVPVLDPQSAKRPKLITFACNCDRGEGLRKGNPKSGYRPVPSYDEHKHFRCLAITDTLLDDLQAWKDTPKPIETHANFNTEFDEWSGSSGR